MSEPSARPGKRDLRDAGDGERVGDAGQHGEREEDDERGDELPSHHTTPEPADDEVDQLDPDEGRDEPAEPVDEQVAAQDRSPPSRRGSGRRAARAGSARR